MGQPMTMMMMMVMKRSSRGPIVAAGLLTVGRTVVVLVGSQHRRYVLVRPHTGQALIFANLFHLLEHAQQIAAGQLFQLVDRPTVAEQLGEQPRIAGDVLQVARRAGEGEENR